MPPHEPPAYLQYLPLLIVVPILFWRMRKLSKPQPLKWQYLWIRPVIFLAIAAMVLVSTPPVALDWLWIGLAALLGAAAGWQWGRTMHIEMHPENGTLMAKGSQAAMLLLVVLVVFRAGLRGGLQMEAAARHLNMVLITDASIVFSALLFAVRGLEMFLRARRVMAAHDAATPAP
jgi:O-antigen/teichoic acid export membrane protein